MPVARNQHGRFDRPITERFLEKVDQSGECWIWTAGRYPKAWGDGYGAFCLNGKNRPAHRVAWELFRGPIPTGLWVLHNCPNGDNSLCVRPSHLWLGTHEDNMRDMVAKGRAPKGDRNVSIARPELLPFGERNHAAKLTNAEALEIRARYARGDGSTNTLAREYGVSQAAIWRLVRQKTWKRVHSA